MHSCSKQTKQYNRDEFGKLRKWMIQSIWATVKTEWKFQSKTSADMSPRAKQTIEYNERNLYWFRM